MVTHESKIITTKEFFIILQWSLDISENIDNKIQMGQLN